MIHESSKNQRIIRHGEERKCKTSVKSEISGPIKEFD